MAPKTFALVTMLALLSGCRPRETATTKAPSLAASAPTASTPLPTASTPLPTASTPLPTASTPLSTASTPLSTASTPLPPGADLEPAPPARVEVLAVPGDRMASIVRAGNSAPVTVFMPGLCSNATAYLQTFPEAARKQGGVVAIEGDQPCGTAVGFRSFSWDAGRQHARIGAALTAAGLGDLPRGGITLVGYSQGASLAEQLVQRWPERYSRVVLIGAPTNPSPKNLARARGLVTMSCDRDVPGRMRDAARAASRAGIPATYVEMAGCTHGNVTEGERVFDTAFDWLRANERPLD